MSRTPKAQPPATGSAAPGRAWHARDEAEADVRAGAVTAAHATVDLSKVRIHADDAADRMATDLNARAFARGRDIYFRHGEWQPGTLTGNRLLAHELAHVEQQERRGVVETQCAPDDQPIAAAARTDEVVAGDHMQQRRAILGATTADELIASDATLQAQLPDLTDRFGSSATAMVHDTLDSVLFRGGPGVAALEDVVQAEAALVKKLRKKSSTDVQAEVAKLRREHADAFASTRAFLIATAIEAVSKPRPITHGAQVGGGPRGLAALDAALQPYALIESQSEVVTPGDRYQQRVALMGAASPEEIFDLDPDFQREVRDVARMYAQVEGASAATAAGGVAEATYEWAHGKLPRGVRPYRDDEGSAEQSRRAAELASMDLTIEQRYAELRAKFIKWGGRVLFERSTGGTALAKLAAAETKLIKAHRKAPVGLEHEVALTRREHASRFVPKLARIKEQFVNTAIERFRFMHEKQPGVRAPLEMHRVADDAEGFQTIADLKGLITAEPTESDLQVADSVVVFVTTLKALSSVDIGASTYRTHSWGRYSVDLFPSIPKNDAGYYDQDAVVEVFRTIDAAARLTNVRWRALYTDFDVAKRVNAELTRKQVGFQWEHGPDPYVLHIHVDIMPLDVTPTTGTP